MANLRTTFRWRGPPRYEVTLDADTGVVVAYRYDGKGLWGVVSPVDLPMDLQARVGRELHRLWRLRKPTTT